MLKWGLVVEKEKNIPRILELEEENLTGLYGWLKCFKGELVTFSDLDKFNVNDYDVLHVNMITLHSKLPQKLRELVGKSSDVKIVTNIDYSIEMIPSLFGHPRFHLGHVADSLRASDLVFCQEKYQCDLFKRLVPGIDIKLIPHPCNTEFVKSFYVPIHEREKEIAVPFHKCEPKGILWSWLGSQNIKDYKTVLYAYRPDKRGFVTYGKFDKVYEAIPFPKYINRVAKSYVALDTYQMHVWGRAVIDLACLGVPVVGSSYIEAMHRLFPKLVVDPYDIAAMRKKLNTLVTNKKLWNECREYAEEQVEYYSLANSRERMLKALEVL